MEFPKYSKDAISLAKATLIAKFRAWGLEIYLKQSTKKRQKDTTLCYNVSEKRIKEYRGGSQSCQRLISSTISSTL